MAFTPVKTWLSGDVILSADMQGNTDGVRRYIHKLRSGDFQIGSTWIDTPNLMKGTYEPTPNRSHLLSGVFCGVVNNARNGEFTYSTIYNTNSTSDYYAYVPRASMTLEVRKASTIFFQYWCTAIGRDNTNATQGVATIGLYKKGLNADGISDVARGSVSRSIEEMAINTDYTIEDGGGIGDTASLPSQLYRYHQAGTAIVDVPEVGEYSIGLCAYSGSSKFQFASWGLSVEAFYL